VSLQDLGNLGEFFGAVAVLASLLYLAVQIRQNTRSLRSAAYQSLSTSLSDLALSVAENDDLAKIWQIGMTDPGRLSEVERLRLQAFLTALYRQYQNLYFQKRQSLLDEELWQAHRVTIMRHISSPGGADWWAIARDQHSKGFVEYVEREVRGGSHAYDPRIYGLQEE
jgi:hypothetical protein